MISFRKDIETTIYLSPFSNFEQHEGKVEIRWDPLTDFTARVVHFPVRKFEKFNFEDAISTSLSSKCPFCEEHASSMTARLDTTIFEAEHLEYGEVKIIPNLLTFDKYSLVAIISKEHYVDMKGLAEKNCIVNGIRSLLEAFKMIRQKDPLVEFFSLNCNYMPMSGGSLIHPHVQGIAGRYATNYHRLMLDRSGDFFQKEKEVFWDVLIREEKERGERFIGESGTTAWYTPFAPKGNIDIGCIFQEPSLFSVSDREWNDFNAGLNKVLAYLDSENVGGFNFTIFAGADEEKGFRTNARIVARRFLPPVNAADVNYFEKIHMESVCLVFPEHVASRLRESW